MKTTTRFSLIVVGAAFAACNLLPLEARAQTNSGTTATPTVSATGSDAQPQQSFKIPTKVEEVAELSKAGVGDQVILSYIKNSDSAFNLNAQDIIALRNQGVSSEVTAAMIQRGAEVRLASQQEAAKQTEAETVAAAPTYQTQPVVEAPAQVTYVATPVQPTSTVSVHYFGTPSYRYVPTYYPRYVSAPNYVTFGSSYYSGPRFSVGVGFGGRYHGGYRSSARFCR